MRQAWLMYRKELLGMARSYQLLWIPVVFLLLVVMQPVTSYYLPDILAASGSVPEELVADFPIPGPAEVMASVLGQYSTFGVFVLVIAGMKIVSGERYGGTAALVLVRPISSASFILAKWAGQMTLLILSFTVSYAAAWYYTVQSCTFLVFLESGRAAEAGCCYNIGGSSRGNILSYYNDRIVVCRLYRYCYLELAEASHTGYKWRIRRIHAFYFAAINP
ncbi:ABC-2 family transporter protein [Fontibacillus panacisegetis]|uniref:ABC-2 family transporter protein n=1 Tax=Fontibacillus panacisegetis TaxID=670482 RepID=A0A1G7UKT5_9BACL|nr:ABC transporter permease subunit [Fontibacillus panacisegetis]SDG47831.1 ABC-2 family transporter protein [Fontibacillus panacisegetis]